MLPDIDHTESIVGRLFWFVSKAINKRFGHRAITHSLIAILFTAVISAGIFIANQQAAIAFFTGYLSAIVGDMLTKSGVKLFWPSQGNWAILENPALRFRTGGVGEFAFLMIIVAACLASFNAVSEGGVAEVFNSYYSGLVGKKSAAVSYYNHHSNQYLIGLEVTGYWASDRRPILKEKFRIIHIEGDLKIYVQNSRTGYLYALEEQIIVEKVRPYKEGIGRKTTRVVSFSDEKLGSKMRTGECYYFGKVALDRLAALPATEPSLEYLKPYLVESNSTLLYGAKREQIGFLEEYVSGQLTEVCLDY